MNFNESNAFTSISRFSKKYRIIEKIGEGSYGKVLKAENPETKELSAIKIYKIQDNKEGIHPTILREIVLLKSLRNHPNIVQLKGVIAASNQIEIDLEYCEGDLFKFIRFCKNDPLIYNMDSIKSIIYQILNGVSELHSSKIFHRDLKPANILIKNGIVKIGDFGLSRVYSLPNIPYSKNISTLWYRAPELFLGMDKYSTSVDVWSIGCIFVELICKEPMFPASTEVGMIQKMIEVFGNFFIDGKLLPGVKYFDNYYKLESYFSKGTEKIGLEEYLREKSKFSLTREMVDLIGKMLQIDPCNRISCIEALKDPFFTNTQK